MMDALPQLLLSRGRRTRSLRYLLKKVSILVRQTSPSIQQNKKRKSNGAVGPRCRLALNLLAGCKGKKILRNRRCSRQLIASGKRSFLPPSIVVHHTTSRTREDQTTPDRFFRPPDVKVCHLNQQHGSLLTYTLSMLEK